MKDDIKLIIKTVRYIEENLKDKLSLEDIAGEAGFSKYYFTRLFVKYTSQSPYDYYRGRKLTETITYMKNMDCRIIDAAFEYGFSSPEVFARACATEFGKSPSVIKKEITSGTFIGIEPISEGYLWFINNYIFEPRIELLDSLLLMGVGYFSDSLNETLYNMPLEQLRDLKTNGNAQLFKVSWIEKQAMGYMNFIGQQNMDGAASDALLNKKLPKMAYLIFDFNLHSEELPYFYNYIYYDYLPKISYEIVTSIHIEVFDIEDSKRVSKLYIPVIPMT
ncbi:MAG: AraC family transcriptional regulator [Vallitaleaceae bacterium]|jgi:AraC family transcriptional regulator|nr:AraC family transcriptional regulator [Vallitaleaceae bacterium]